MAKEKETHADVAALPFEKALAELESIVQRLEKGDVALEESIKIYERGEALKVIACEAPLRAMFGYATELRSLTRGRAVFTMRHDRYDIAG